MPDYVKVIFVKQQVQLLDVAGTYLTLLALISNLLYICIYNGIVRMKYEKHNLLFRSLLSIRRDTH